MDPVNLIQYEACANYNTWSAILISTTFWCASYYILKKICKEKSPEWCSRVITLMHGCSSAITGLSECATSEFFDHWRTPQTEKQQIILLVSLGYFIFDLIWCLYYQTESKIMLLHHILSTVGLFRLLHNNYAGSQTCCGVGGMEVTNPLLQIRWFIRNNGSDKAWFVYSDIIFVICFLIMRCGFGTYFFMNVVFYHDYEREYMLYTTVLYIISWLFVINIIQYLYVKYRKTVESSKSPANTSTVNSAVTVNVSVSTAVQNARRPTVNINATS